MHILSYLGSGSLNKDSLQVPVEVLEASVDLVGTGGVLDGQVVGGLPLMEVPLGLVVQGVVVVEPPPADLEVVEPQVPGQRVALGPGDVELPEQGLDLVDVVGVEGAGQQVGLEDPAPVAVVGDGPGVEVGVGGGVPVGEAHGKYYYAGRARALQHAPIAIRHISQAIGGTVTENYQETQSTVFRGAQQSPQPCSSQLLNSSLHLASHNSTFQHMLVQPLCLYQLIIRIKQIDMCCIIMRGIIKQNNENIGLYETQQKLVRSKLHTTPAAAVVV